MNDPVITVRLADCFGREVAWVRPHLFRREHQLVLDNDVLAVMRYQGFRRTQVRSARGQWLIERSGVLGRSAVMSDAASGAEVLTIGAGLRRGEFSMPGGQKYGWSRLGFLKILIRVSDANGTPLVDCGTRVALGRRRGYLALHPAAPQHPHLDLLVLAVWSVVHRHQVRRRRS